MASFEYVKIGDGITPWSNLPYVAGFPGSTGPTGYTGAAGVNGVSGGLTSVSYTHLTLPTILRV